MTMKHLTIVPLLLLLSLSVFGQTPVDNLVRAIDSLSMTSFDSWRVSPDLKSFSAGGDATRPDFNDSKWDLLTINTSIYPDSCWLRKEITLPQTYLGQPVRGTIRFLVSVDDYGYVWVNGEEKGRFNWDGDFVISKDAQPGQKFVIAIKAINTGGPLRLLRAELRTESASATKTMLEDFTLSLKTGQKLLGFETYQTNARQRSDPGIDKSTMERTGKSRLGKLLQETAAGVDVGALGRGDMKTFMASIDDARFRLKPVGLFAKQFTITFDANAHIDAAWLWREGETVEVCKNTFTSVLNMMDARQDFTYTQSSAAYYEWMERLYPDIFKRIRERVNDGRWEIIGGMWIEPDCNLPSGESWMRQMLYAKKYFAKKFGKDVKIGWNPDSFGYNWNMPQFYRMAGIDAFITQKIGWNETNVFPHRLFWWEGPDGSRVLSYFPFDYVNEITDPYRLVDWTRQFEANTGLRNMMVLFGVGDHGGGPTNEMLDRIDRLRKLDIYPAIEYRTAGQYIEWLKTQNLSTVPVWNDELYLEYHQGTFTTQAKMKANNRLNETLLTNAEKFSSIAALNGRTYNAADLESAWSDAMFNQFHDILPGSSIREVYIDAAECNQRAQQIAGHELRASLDHIAGRINSTPVRGARPLVVFNPLAWERTDIASFPLAEGDQSSYAVVDASGKTVPSTIVTMDRYHRDILFLAEHIPSMGYSLFGLKHVAPAPANPLPESNGVIENATFRIAIDPVSGWLKSIVDKRSGKELLAGPGNELQMLEDRPKAWDAWNVGLTGTKYPLRLKSIRLTEQCPLRSVLRVTWDYLKPGTKKDFPAEEYASSFFTQDVILYNGVDRIEFVTGADWWEEKTMLKVAFPVTVADTVATYEIPYGSIRRSTQMLNSREKAQVEVPAQRWADLSDGEYGVSLLNRAKYGYDIKGNTMRLSLLRSPIWPDPTADRGKHSMEYALYPHAGSWKTAGTVRRGYEYNNPLIVVGTDAHKGSLQVRGELFRLTPENCVLTSIKKAEDSDALIVQWYEAAGTETEAVLTLPKKPSRVVRTNVMEDDLDAVPFEGRTVKVRNGRNAVVTLKISF
jgi:alpha-mannosidase